jgi:undecaprenyl-diphosphatase
MQEVQNKKLNKSFLSELSLKFLLIVLSFIAALFLFGFMAHELFYEKDELFDKRIVEFLSAHATQEFVSLMKLFTLIGSGKFLIPAYAIMVIYCFSKRKAMVGIHVAMIALSSYGISHAAKRIFQRPRPDLPLIESIKTYSFPSGHALSAFIFCSIVFFLIWNSSMRQLWKWIFSIILFLIALIVGISRVVLSMHYPTDVLAGFCLGFIWVVFCFYVLGHIKHKRTSTVKLPL